MAYSEKTLKTKHGELEIRMPRDRSASFELGNSGKREYAS